MLPFARRIPRPRRGFERLGSAERALVLARRAASRDDPGPAAHGARAARPRARPPRVARARRRGDPPRVGGEPAGERGDDRARRPGRARAGRPAVSQHAIPLADTADLGRLARRTTIVRIGLLRGDPRGGRLLHRRDLDRLHVGEATLLGPGSSGVVVLDLSSSTDSAPPREIPGVLRHLANAGGRSGLVLFSDVAYEALPLGATSEELRPFLRYFRRPALPPRRSPARTAGSRARRRSCGARRRGRGRSGREPGSRPGSRAPAGWCSRSRRAGTTSSSSATSTTRCSMSPPSSRRCDATSATGSTSASWRSARPSRTAASS